MEELTPSIWFPVVTLIAGAVLKGLFDWLAESRKASIEHRVRFEKRQEVLLMHRLETQRKLLPELQEALLELMRCTGLVNLADITSWRDSGKWGKGKLPNDLDEKSRVAFRQVTLFRVRVQDEALRAAILDLSLTCTSVSVAGSESESNKFLEDASFKYDHVNEQIGRVLRALDSSENAIFENP
ncbi:hypothetical protein ACLEJW_09190 [Pseudomonas sp. SMSB3]|uniref:hypothetical protein n=1 Tax=Pseudomonas sp. SMSB3 TaxID=3390196 RepID=UPI003F829516